MSISIDIIWMFHASIYMRQVYSFTIVIRMRHLCMDMIIFRCQWCDVKCMVGYADINSIPCVRNKIVFFSASRTWWRHQMETFSALLAICAGKSPVPSEFPAQRPVTGSFDAFFDLHLNKRLSKQSWGWWFETLLRPLWRHSNELAIQSTYQLFNVWHAWILYTPNLPEIDNASIIGTEPWHQNTITHDGYF